MSQVPIGFEFDPVMVPIEMILLSRKLPAGIIKTRKYLQIRSSIVEIGLIEPLSVAPSPPKTKQHVLLDGHLRLFALQELGHVNVPCLIASDDESYTYNNRLTRLTSVQEYHMIRLAIARGVPPARLARALNVDERTITRKATLLNGICPEAADLLKDAQFSSDLAKVLRQMKPMRQVECAELMISANTVTVSYAEAMLVATPANMLVAEKKSAKLTGITQEQMAKMEREMSNLQGQYKAVEQTYGQDVLNLVLAKSYLAKLLANKPVARYLKQRHSEFLAEFEMIIHVVSLEG